MYRDPTVGDILENTHTYEPARVIEVSNQYGSFKVEYLGDGRVREHRYGRIGCSSFVKMTNAQRADLYLRLENAGLTDFWRED